METLAGYLVVEHVDVLPAYRGVARMPYWPIEEHLDQFIEVCEHVDDEWLSPDYEAAQRTKRILERVLGPRLDIAFVSLNVAGAEGPPGWRFAGYDLATSAPYESAILEYVELGAAPAGLNEFGLMDTALDAGGLEGEYGDWYHVWKVWLPPA